MLRVILELVPHGNESLKTTVGTLEIANNRTGTPEVGNYDFSLTGFEADKRAGVIKDAAVHNMLWCSGKLNGFKRSRGYWSTVKEVLNKIKTDL